MGIKQQPDGTWHAFYQKRHPSTRIPVSLRRKGIKSKAEAQRVKNELVLLVEEKLKAVVVPRWATLVDEYIVACRENGLMQKTIDNIDKCLKAATNDWNGRFVDAITTDEIRSLVKGKYGAKSESHQKQILKFVRGALAHAVDKGYLNRNPAPKLTFRIGDKLKGAYNPVQIRHLLTQAKAIGWEWYPHYVMACYCGMRSGELYALTWDKVDLEHRQIKVDRAWNSKDGFKSTKSGDDRMLEIAPNLLVLLKEWKLKAGDEKFVLPRLKDWATGRQAEKFREFALGIGLPQIRFHDLRASWCTIMLGKGIEPVKVMKMGGWKDMKTMMKYLRQAGVDIKGITDSLDLHDPLERMAKVVSLDFGSDS